MRLLTILQTVKPHQVEGYGQMILFTDILDSCCVANPEIIEQKLIELEQINKIKIVYDSGLIIGAKIIQR